MDAQRFDSHTHLCRALWLSTHLQGAGSSCKNKIWDLADNIGTSARISILQSKTNEIFLEHRVTLKGLHHVTLGGTVEVPLLWDTAWAHSLCGHKPRASTRHLLCSSPLSQPQLALSSHQYQEKLEDNICIDCIWAATLMKIKSHHASPWQLCPKSKWLCWVTLAGAPAANDCGH